jgi:hypothetical protein
MNKCPLCNHEVGAYHEVTFDKPYTHTNPYDGIHIYGAYSAPKETICYDEKFLHFAFYDADGNLVDHRLVQLGVENPTTKTATDEFWEGYNDSDEHYFNDDADDFEEVFDDDEWDEIED